MKRTFIAVDISDEARESTALYIDGLRRSFRNLRVGWERPEKLHLTLKFLGDVNDGRLDGVQRAVGDVASETVAFRIILGGTGRFPPRGDTRILWLGVGDEGQLQSIAARIDTDLARLGFEKEKRRLSPHLTIARLREPRSSAELAATHLGRDFGPIELDVREIVIYESKLTPNGSIYTPMAAMQLKAP